MNTSELFVQLIDNTELEINQNSVSIREYLNQLKTFQITYELEVDAYNQSQLTENVKKCSEYISDLINAQTELIEFYAKLSGYMLLRSLEPNKAGDPEMERRLLQKSLTYYLAKEDYMMCSKIKLALEQNKDAIKSYVPNKTKGAN